VLASNFSSEKGSGSTLRFRFSNCEFDTDRRELRRAGEVVPVEPQVFELLTYLIANNQRVVSKDELLAAVWEGRIVSESAMTTRVNAARCAVGDNGYEQRLIKTVRRKGFRFIAPVREIDALHPPRRVAAQPALNKPSLAVLPFRSLARDPAERCFSANLIEQLTSLLCKYPWVSVSARSGALNTGRNFLPTHVQYLLGGSVRKSASTVRVAAHLIDVSSDTYLWADHFDRDYDETFEAQDNLAEKLVGAIAPRLERFEIERTKHEPDGELLDARACSLRGLARLYTWTQEGIAQALRLFQRAIEIDPEFAPAYGLAAYCYVQRQSYGWFTDRSREVTEAVQLARSATQFGVDDALTLSKAAHAITMIGGDGDSGAALIDLALLSNRHLPAAWYVSGWVQLHLGNPQSAMDHLAHALHLSPFDPLIFKVHAAVAYAHFLKGSYDEGAASAERALQMRPRYQTALRAAAASHALAGRIGEAKKFMTHMRRHDPALRLSRLHQVLPLRRREDFGKCVDALQRAGLPD
jgi:DNA-binding winged helix-turn-helix (wHTH) protein/tetratricopeptide (TPR) repeat protein